MDDIDALVKLVRAERRLRQSPYKKVVITNEEAHMERLRDFDNAWIWTPEHLKMRIMALPKQAWVPPDAVEGPK